MSQLRDTIGYILTHNIIYSKQYEKIEYGEAGEQLEKLLDSEMGKFAEWIDKYGWITNSSREWINFNTEGHYTNSQLIELYKNRNKT